ncbi:MAG TPA: hypothetical protein VJQ83_07030 [Tepidiformaceae bacterium]|nr:hypothetical protein [Tepidiformaceae bacterium]
MGSAGQHGESFADIRERQRRERLHLATGYHGGRRVFLCGLFALSLFLAVAALAMRQATSPDAARNVLGAGIARITSLDRLLAQDLPNANATGADKAAPPLPGFPIDIQLTHADVAGKSTAAVRDLVLDRATSRVYNDGVKAFDRTGQQSVSRFSGEGLLTTLADQITGANHHRASLALIVFVILTAAAAGALLLAAEEGRRGRLLGIGILAAGLSGLLISVAAWFGVGATGGSDPFIGALRSLARSVLDVPLRDFAIVTALGVIVLFAGPLVSLASRPFLHQAAEGDEATDQPADGYNYAHDDDDYEFDDVIIDDDEDDEIEARV